MGNLKEKILKFLDVGNGYGWDTGCSNGGGSGYGCGDGGDNNTTDYSNGIGESIGYGYGCYSGNNREWDGGACGYGSGNNYGNDITNYNGYDVYLVDEIPTIITHLHGNIAKGFIATGNLFIVPCYVARVGNYLAHGSTAKEALADAQAKYDQNKPLEERIADFKTQYPKLTDIAPNTELYRWHNILTGSCTFGRQHFAEQHNIDIDNGSMSVLNFIELTIKQYGGNVIEQLKESYE